MRGGLKSSIRAHRDSHSKVPALLLGFILLGLFAMLFLPATYVAIAQTSPSVTSVTPVRNALNVAADSNIAVTFNQAILSATVATTTLLYESSIALSSIRRRSRYSRYIGSVRCIAPACFHVNASSAISYDADLEGSNREVGPNLPPGRRYPHGKPSRR